MVAVCITMGISIPTATIDRAYVTPLVSRFEKCGNLNPEKTFEY